ncbi:hypothetical protein BGW37DRAFT_484972 [Umbelopsis sp. PMI_123]|nr:hypothetical protein BGW37DRAFT_484972 [Umbelopsis sp. PMI_123]
MCSFVMFILAFLYVPNYKNEGSAEKVDVLGFLLVTSGFILIIYALSDGQWHLARDPVTLVIGVVLIAAFLVWQFKATYPLLRPSWWRRQNFASLSVSALSTMQYSWDTYIQRHSCIKTPSTTLHFTSNFSLLSAFRNCGFLLCKWHWISNTIYWSS